MPGVLMRRENLDTGRYEQREGHVKMEGCSHGARSLRLPKPGKEAWDRTSTFRESTACWLLLLDSLLASGTETILIAAVTNHPVCGTLLGLH